MVIKSVRAMIFVMAVVVLFCLLPSENKAPVQRQTDSFKQTEVEVTVVQKIKKKLPSKVDEVLKPLVQETIQKTEEKEIVVLAADIPKVIDRGNDGRDFDFSNPRDREMAEDIFNALNSSELNPVIESISPSQMRDLGVVLTLPSQVSQ